MSCQAEGEGEGSGEWRGRGGHWVGGGDIPTLVLPWGVVVGEGYPIQVLPIGEAWGWGMSARFLPWVLGPDWSIPFPLEVTWDHRPGVPPPLHHSTWERTWNQRPGTSELGYPFPPEQTHNYENIILSHYVRGR